MGSSWFRERSGVAQHSGMRERMPQVYIKKPPLMLKYSSSDMMYASIRELPAERWITGISFRYRVVGTERLQRRI
jgi:hypothetical protein